MSGVIVRQAVAADLDDLAELFDQYRRFQGQPGALQAARDFLRARFDHGESVIFIAQAAGAALGFAQLYPSFSSVSLARVFILNDLYVAAAGRRRGVATRLLAAVERHAWSFGAVRITLNVAQDNLQAQALYEARQWQRDGQFFMYHRFAAAGAAAASTAVDGEAEGS
ncbi:MAG: GNAT family N-acetyltransferase [Proteobacteria bacterium]|nr:GNAT family N-acetyltransferase [Pseudomonadota bacterium]